ncbi:MAG: VanZ family protein, partial [Eubacterium sp.]|nr:VanZ family protein [Eubacterium sp.]
MKKALQYTAAMLFAAAYPFCMLSSSYHVKSSYFGFHSITYIYIRYLIIFITLFVLVYLNRKNEKLLTVFVPTALLSVSAFAYFDYFITGHLLQNYSYMLWLGAVISLTNAALFLSATVFCNGFYERFYRRFWISYLPIYILILYVSFIREPNSFEFSVNLIPTQGTFRYFKAIFQGLDESLYVSLVCFGNLLVLAPLPFIISAVKRLPLPVMLIIGLALPVLFEGYQYIFKCGNVDIDDCILNTAGYLAGLATELKIHGKKIKEPLKAK